jgi:hypothetical protein
MTFLLLVVGVAPRAEAFLPAGVVAPVMAPIAVTIGDLTVGISGAVAGAGAAGGGVAAAGLATAGVGVVVVGAGLLLGWGLYSGAEAIWGDPDPEPSGVGYTQTRITDSGSTDFSFYEITATRVQCYGYGGAAPHTTNCRTVFTGKGNTFQTRGYCGNPPVLTSSSSNLSFGGTEAGELKQSVCSGDSPSSPPLSAFWMKPASGYVGGGVNDPWEKYGISASPSVPASRRIQSTFTCRAQPSGGTRTVTTQTAAYTLVDSTPRPHAMGYGECAAGERMTGMVVERVGTNGSGAEVIPRRGLVNWQVPASEVDPANPNAACLANAAAPCTLRVQKQIRPGTWRECSDPDVSCVGWASGSSPQREQDYRCMWGDILLALNQCAALATAYQPDGQTQTITSPEPDLDDAAATDPAAQTDTRVTTGAQSLGAQLATKVPFSIVTAVVGWVDATLPASEGGGPCWQVEPDLGEVGGEHLVVDSCGPSGVTATVMGYRSILVVLMHATWAVPLMWWAWRQYAPGSQGNA